MKYLNITLFTILFTCLNINAQEKDTTITDVEESSFIDSDIKQTKDNKTEKVSDFEKILEKRFNLAKDGRGGPVWIDVPLDVQALSLIHI